MTDTDAAVIVTVLAGAAVVAAYLYVIARGHDQ